MLLKLTSITLITFLAFATLAEERLKNRVALITGGSQGIGKGIAEVFTNQGAKVIIISRTKTKLENVTEEISRNGGHIRYMVADITKANDMKKVVDKIVKQYGRLDILIHNAAGLYPYKKLQDMSYEEWREALKTNLDAVFLVTKSVLPQMQKQKYGRIVYTSSINIRPKGWTTW
jgi:3-oxoacyl-[acyl-carrier protein] reductase